MPLSQKSPLKDRNPEVDRLFSLVYEELRRLASLARRNEAHVTLNSTGLVHEAWLKLKDSPHLRATSLPHFKAIAAKAMRQVLVDEARRRGARKRGGSGEVIFVGFGDSSEAPVSNGADLLVLDAALEKLAQAAGRQAQVVENRFFGGLSVAETAALLGISESAVERDWRAAKAWLAAQIRSARS